MLLEDKTGEFVARVREYRRSAGQSNPVQRARRPAIFTAPRWYPSG